MELNVGDFVYVQDECRETVIIGTAYDDNRRESLYS